MGREFYIDDILSKSVLLSWSDVRLEDGIGVVWCWEVLIVKIYDMFYIC